MDSIATTRRQEPKGNREEIEMKKQVAKRNVPDLMADLSILAVIVCGAGKIAMAVFGLNF